MSITARLRRLEERRPPAPPPAPARLTDDELLHRWEALTARVLDPDTGEPDPTRPDYARYRRVDDLLALARQRRDAGRAGDGMAR